MQVMCGGREVDRNRNPLEDQFHVFNILGGRFTTLTKDLTQGTREVFSELKLAKGGEKVTSPWISLTIMSLQQNVNILRAN